MMQHQVLRSGKRGGLRLAQGFLTFAQTIFHLLQRLALGLQIFLVLRQRDFRRVEKFSGDNGEFTLGGATAFLGLRNFSQRLGILRRQFGQPLLVELNPAFVPVNLALQFKTRAVLRSDLHARVPTAARGNARFHFQNVKRHLIPARFRSTIFDCGILPGNFHLQDVELMPRELRFEMLQFRRNLLVAFGSLARLTLARSRSAASPPGLGPRCAKDGASDRACGGIHFFLRLEFSDSGGFLENHPPVFRFAGKNLSDVALRENASSCDRCPCFHEQLLDVLEPARGSFVQEICAAAVAENPARGA